MTDSEFNTMIEKADRKYKFSDIVKRKNQVFTGVLPCDRCKMDTQTDV